jgi:hypothetical protein
MTNPSASGYYWVRLKYDRDSQRRDQQSAKRTCGVTEGYVVAVRRKDFRETIPQEAVETTCWACGEAILLSPSSVCTIKERRIPAICEPCVPAVLGGRTPLLVMTASAIEEYVARLLRKAERN